MKTDLVLAQKNKLVVKTYDDGMVLLNEQTEDVYSFRESLTTIISDEATKNIDVVLFFSELIKFQNVVVDFIAELEGDINFYYTLDGNSWRTFNRFSLNISSLDLTDLSPEDKRIIESFDKSIVKSESLSGTSIYTFFNEHNILKQSGDLEHRTMIRFLENYPSNFSLKNIFEYVANDGTPNLFFDFYVMGFKIEIRNCSVIDGFPYKINKLELWSDISLTLTDDHYYPSVFYLNFFKPKYFYEYDFIPNSTKVFLEMMEYKNS